MIYVKDEHPSIAFPSMNVTYEVIVICINDEQFSKAEMNLVINDGIEIFFNLVFPFNKSFGISCLFNKKHFIENWL